MRARRTIGLLVAGALGAGAAWQRVSPSACPYSLRWLLAFPRPHLGADRLVEVLEPAPGERLLELGPGLGHGALPVARRLVPDGTLVAVDVQQEMLDELGERARQQGIENLELRQADATSLPFEDAAFDGAYLVTVLGEIQDQDAALRELHRVVAPGGRVVFGETLFDPHVVSLRSLRRRCEAAGSRFERLSGRPPLGYYARFGVG